MIRKTQSNFRRRVRSPIGSYHSEVILRETWWLLFLPLYSREKIEATSL